MGGIAVFPGSFNPPTVAHLAIVDAAIEHHGLERLDLTVSRVALAKEHVEHPRFEERIAVIEASVADRAKVTVVVTEAKLLVDIANGYDLLILGADKWAQIQEPHWYGSDAERNAAMHALPSLAVFPRDQIEIPADIRLDLDGYLHISSTRARLGQLDLMTGPAADFARATGAWIDPPRYQQTDWISPS